ncbi:MAG: hypothetical protein INH37_21795 [Myxococcaceae bacterium]|nr:hypothetical protein [Myxococcaceae bacterium]
MTGCSGCSGCGQRWRVGAFRRAGALALVSVAWLVACPAQPKGPEPRPLPQPSPTIRPLEAIELPPVASLAGLEGRVDLERDGGLAAASAGPLFEGDAIVTGADGRALLSDESGRQLELGADTRFAVGPRLSDLEVLQGDFRILSSGRSGIGSVRTPYGEASLPPGTNGRFGVADGGLRIEVLEGTFVITGLDAGAGDGAREPRLELLPGTFEILGTTSADARGLSLEVLEGTFTISRPDGGPTRAGKGERLEVLQGTFTILRPDGGLADAGAGERVEVLPGTFSIVTPDGGSASARTPPGGPSPSAAPKAGRVRVVVESGRPSVKQPGQAAFAPARSGDELAPGTQLRAVGGALRLEGGGAWVQLRGGAAGVTEGVRDVGGTPALALTRVVGPLTVQLDGTGRGVVQVGDVVVGGADEATIAVTEVGKKRRFEVQAGAVELVVDGAPRRLEAGQGVLVEGTRVTPLELAPALEVRFTSRIWVHADGVSTLAIRLPEETNRVEVARDQGFAAPFIAGAVGRRVLVPGLARGTLFLRTTEPAGAPRATGRVDFLPDVASERDIATRLGSVEDTGQPATVFFQSKVPTLTFTFKPVKGAKRWRFRLYPASALDRLLEEREVDNSELILESGRLAEGTYAWSASPLDDKGRELPDVKVWLNKLEIRYDNGRTTLLIEQPMPGERVGPEARASGVMPEHSQLYVNEQLVRSDARGRFSVPVGAVDVVRFRLASADGERYWLRRLKR